MLNKLGLVVSNPSALLTSISSRATSSSVEAVHRLLPNVSPAQINSYHNALCKNQTFLNALHTRMMDKRGRIIKITHRQEFLYMVVRATQPKIIFETGVFDGSNSAFLLQGLADNARGELISIDLPAVNVIKDSTDRMTDTALPNGCAPGWIIPNNLRQRHRLELGDSKELLPKLLQEYKRTDIFLHDSLHTYAHQYFEYNEAWNYLPIGGILISDDILWSAAFYKFCREQKRQYVNLGNFGAVVK